MNNLCYSYNKLGKYSNALEGNKQILEIKRKILGKDHLNFAETLFN
jgi:hypothetical protein